MHDEYIQERGIAYRVNDFEKGRKTLLFIHGLSGSASAWYPYEEKLKNKYNVVTYDLRGHGRSRKFLHYQDYAIENFAEDLAFLIEHLQIEMCTLVAHSFGTSTALEYLIRTPAPVSSLICISPNFKIRTLLRTQITRPFVVLATVILQVFPFRPRQGDRIDYRGLGWSSDWSLRRIIPEIRSMTLRIYLYCLRHMYAFAHDEQWSQINIPVLVVHGSRDTFVPISHGRAMAKEISNAQFVVLEGANHMLVLNNKTEILEEIERFVTK